MKELNYMKQIKHLPFAIRGFVLFVMAMTLALTNGCRSEKVFSDSEVNPNKPVNSTLAVKNEQAFLAGLSTGTNLTIEAEVFINGKQVDNPSWTVSSENESIVKVDKTLN
ncbi:hypothetical protein VCHA40P240_230006 [Vibrio chagasii]|nr:hypothetical protein VCHA40P240_230006 [Vibrio chagasii]